MSETGSSRVVVTGAAGYVGSLLCSHLLGRGWSVRGVDTLLYGGDALLPFLGWSGFEFHHGDVTAPGGWEKLLEGASTVVHLAAIVGFPACQSVGRTVAWRYNVEGTRNVLRAAERAGVERFVLASSYSVYGMAPGRSLDEESALQPPSLYAESKVAAERALLDLAATGRISPVILRLTSPFGISPRTRFDLLVNQFVLEAMTRRELVIYQRGYSRSFLHVRDVVRGIEMAMEAPREEIHGEVFNLGGEEGNLSKDEVVRLVQEHVPHTSVHYKDLTFGGDTRDLVISFEKVRRRLGFQPEVTVTQGILEVRDALQRRLIGSPEARHHRNAQFIVQ